jgi:hypothetical protein
MFKSARPSRIVTPSECASSFRSARRCSVSPAGGGPKRLQRVASGAKAVSSRDVRAGRSFGCGQLVANHAALLPDRGELAVEGGLADLAAAEADHDRGLDLLEPGEVRAMGVGVGRPVVRVAGARLQDVGERVDQRRLLDLVTQGRPDARVELGGLNDRRATGLVQLPIPAHVGRRIPIAVLLSQAACRSDVDPAAAVATLRESLEEIDEPGPTKAALLVREERSAGRLPFVFCQDRRDRDDSAAPLVGVPFTEDGPLPDDAIDRGARPAGPRSWFASHREIVGDGHTAFAGGNATEDLADDRGGDLVDRPLAERARVGPAVGRRTRGFPTLGDRAKLASLDSLGALPVLFGGAEGLDRDPELAEHGPHVETAAARRHDVDSEALERTKDQGALLDAIGSGQPVDIDDDQEIEPSKLGVAKQGREAVARVELASLRRAAVVDVGPREGPALRRDERGKQAKLILDRVFVALGGRRHPGVDRGAKGHR